MQPNPNAIAQDSQTLLTKMAKAADVHWMDFSETRNGQVLLNSEEMSVADRIKNAFIHGDIMAQTGVIADFIQAGLTDFLLPQRRIRWNTVEGFLPVEGQELPDLVFLERHHTGGMILHHGKAQGVIPHPELTEAASDTPAAPVLCFRLHTGEEIKNVVAFTTTSSILATFAL